uniref:Ribonuclease A-domain domain-containing protein n=1 Tax=Astatotilapia calliptera TaxID=8154 RepID=A0A3P8RGR5_ASTCA
RLPVRAPAWTVSVVVSLGKTLHLLPTGGGERARWRQCPAASPLSPLQCSSNRNIRDNNGNCKRENTFIISNFNQVRTVCDPRNRINVNRNLYRSPRNMRILYCKLLGQTTNTHCKYKQIQMRKRIVIACDKIRGGFLQPVHFQAVGLLTASLLI